MEQTLGKRIAENRKHLKMTQDQLAEQLGVTAQAVSKWENDQSCPDITILPKLAEIFGCSTDALLGHKVQETIHQAEVVTEEDNEDEVNGLHFQKGNWEFKWDGGKRSAIATACLVLLFGGLLLASRICSWNASWWDILWPSALLVFGLKSLLHKFSFFSLGITLFGGYFLLNYFGIWIGIWDISLGGELLLPIAIVLFGLSLLVDALRKPNSSRFQVLHDGKDVCGEHGKCKSEFSVDNESFTCSLSFSDACRLVAMPRLSSGVIDCSFGDLTVDLCGCEELAKNCLIQASCSFGDLTLRVPRRFRVEPNASTSFASVDMEGKPEENPEGVIRLEADASFGSIEIQYI